MEARTRVLDPETRERPGSAHILSTLNLLHTIGNVFEKILLSEIRREVFERGLLRDEQFGADPNTALRYCSPVLQNEYPGGLTKGD